MLHAPRFRALATCFLTGLLICNYPMLLRAQQPDRPQSPPPKSEQQPRPQQPPTQPEQQPDPEAVVRITTQLVQIDAVVTDKKGAHVEDLTEDDFELSVDGKKQPITHFQLIKLPEPKPAEKLDPKDKKNDKTATAPTTMPTRMVAPEEVRRTIAFVIDDLGLSFESTHFTREALKKFVREQMQEGDLVGIIRTGRGLGALQQFTSDKRILYAAIDKLTWNPYSRDMMPRFGANDPNDVRSQEARDAEARFEDFRETVFSVGTLGALNFVVRGLRELPGRKMAILVSDGFRLFGRNRDNDQVLQNLRRLVDLANRASVVIYSIDAKGLLTLAPDASTSGAPRPEDFARVAQDNFDSQEGLTYVARETGGIAFLNNNDLNLGIQRALRDAQSYYLLGFDPEDEKFDRKYHSIKMKVGRPGLQVRTRAGFLGVPDRPRREDLAQLAGPAARDRQFLGALFSPFGARDISLQMTSFFFSSPNPKRGQKNEPENLSFVRSLLHIDPSKLTFKDHPEQPGKKQLKLEVVNFLFNETGAIIDQKGYSFGLAYDPARLNEALTAGLTYTDDFVMKKPGAYQFRMVLRDPESGLLGSASQFIQVPDLTKKRLALSGLVLTPGPDEPGAAKPAPAASSEINPSPAVRRFARSSLIDYGAVVYNATFDPPTGKPQLSAQTEVYQNGKRIYQSPERPIEGGIEGKLIECRGRLRLTGFPPGDYLLHLVVTDTLAKQKYARAEQWIDFSVR